MMIKVENKDLKLLNKVSDQVEKIVPEIINKLKDEYDEDIKIESIEHPLDKNIREYLNKLKGGIRDEDDDFYIFKHIDIVKEMWSIIIGKSIKCLRFFDKREPFLTHPNKQPLAYGVKELSNYFKDYSEFESMLYGGGKYYRDHVIHVFRVWILGLSCLLDDDAKYLKNIVIESGIEVNLLEKISMWSIIALTHDLGYPLEKSQEIIDKTKNMMKSFVSNPAVSVNLSFNGVQNNMNDFVVRFISSKMHEYSTICPKDENKKEDNKKYVARLQPKYYFKFQKSLERCKHGIISSIIIYKLLIYFLESDFNINEDYRFDKEDARQFYIRREILRSIASHTCHDIYHLTMLSFSYLLIIADDSQEWGRKRLSELYVKSDSDYELVDIVSSFDKNSRDDIHCNECTIIEKFNLRKSDKDGIKQILKSLQDQYEKYKEIFRDGQDTENRDFIFNKRCEIEQSTNNSFNIELCIPKENHSTFKIELSSSRIVEFSNEFGINFLKELYQKNIKEIYRVRDKIIFELQDTYE